MRDPRPARLNPAPQHRDSQQLAEDVAKAMMARDRSLDTLGIRLESIGPGRATLSMTVRDDMLNGHGICHGGFIFTLADSAFAYACNSHDHNTVAGGCSIDYLRPVSRGEVLTATGVEVSLSGRSGIYDITVTDRHGARVAVFRGRSVRVKGDVIAGLQAHIASG